MAETVTPTVDDTPPPASTRRERRGWYIYDWANSAFQTTVITVFLGPFITTVAELAAGCELGADTCDGYVYPLGIRVAAGSYYPYLISLSVFLTVFVLPVIGAIADRSAHKKRLLGGAAFTGAGATVAMIFVTGDRYLLGGALFLVANISFGAALVVYNSFLPQLGGPDERDGISSRGWALGYLGGGLLLAFNLVAVTLFSEDDNPQRTLDLARWSIVSAGVWWAVFTLVPLRWLRERPGAAAALTRQGNVLTDGFRQLGRTLREIKAYPLTLFFLLAFLVYRHPDCHHPGQPVRHRGAAPGAEHPDHHHPAGAVPRLRRRVEPRRVGPAHRRLEDGAAQPDPLDRCDHRRVPAAGRGAGAVHDPRRGHRPGARRQPGAEPVAVQPAHPGR